MIAPGVFVTVSVLPLVVIVALPDTTVPPLGFASAAPEKQSATATTETRGLTPGFPEDVGMSTFSVLRTDKAIK
jgi:hypothetical protein